MTTTYIGTFEDAPGVPATGRVWFIPDVPVTRDLSADRPVTLAPPSTSTDLDATGSLNFPRPSSDDPDYSPHGWTYRVRVELDGRDPFEFHVPAPAGETVDLALAAPATYSDGTPVLRGPRGPKGDDGEDGDAGPSPYDLAVAGGFEGSVEDWLASLKGDPGEPAVVLDTGWRSVNEWLNTGWSAIDGDLLVRRVGDMVHYAGGPLTRPSGTSTFMVNLPAGFVPSQRSIIEGARAYVLPPVLAVVAPNTSWDPGGSYLTDDPFPDEADWPGTPWTP